MSLKPLKDEIWIGYKFHYLDSIPFIYLNFHLFLLLFVRRLSSFKDFMQTCSICVRTAQDPLRLISMIYLSGSHLLVHPNDARNSLLRILKKRCGKENNMLTNDVRFFLTFGFQFL